MPGERRVGVGRHVGEMEGGALCPVEFFVVRLLGPGYTRCNGWMAIAYHTIPSQWATRRSPKMYCITRAKLAPLKASTFRSRRPMRSSLSALHSVTDVRTASGISPPMEERMSVRTQLARLQLHAALPDSQRAFSNCQIRPCR